MQAIHTIGHCLGVLSCSPLNVAVNQAFGLSLTMTARAALPNESHRPAL